MSGRLPAARSSTPTSGPARRPVGATVMRSASATVPRIDRSTARRAAPRGRRWRRRRPSPLGAVAASHDARRTPRPPADPRSTSPSGARGRPASPPPRRRGSGRRSGARRARSRSCVHVGRDVHEQPVARAGAAAAPARALITLNVARSTSPACAPAVGARLLVLRDDVAPRQRRRRTRCPVGQRAARHVTLSTAPPRSGTARLLRTCHRIELVEVVRLRAAPARGGPATPCATGSGTTSATRAGRPPSCSSTRADGLPHRADVRRRWRRSAPAPPRRPAAARRACAATTGRAARATRRARPRRGADLDAATSGGGDCQRQSRRLIRRTSPC